PPRGGRASRLHRARLACLERHRGELAAFVDALGEPTTVVIHRAASAMHGLTPLEDCEDEVSLLAASDRDVGRKDRTLELDRAIGSARALRTTGRPQEARAEIDGVIDAAGTE